MRHISCAVLVLLIGAVAAMAQIAPPPASEPAAEAETINHAEFAVLVLQALGSEPPEQPNPEQALAEVKRLGLVPQTWAGADLLTHGELADVLERIGAHYTPTDREAYAARPFVEALLRREMLLLRDYPSRRMGVGDSLSHILDEGVDRGVVSPSEF